VFALALSACGHSGSAVVPAARGAAAPAATPAPSVGAAASAKRSTMTISIAIPAKKAVASRTRGTKTVSPSTAYVDVVLQSLDGDAQPVNGPYSTLVPVSQIGTCSTGGRAHGRAPQSAHERVTQSNYGCVSVSVAAPVGNAVYAVGALDSNMTLLDYADGVPVTVTSSGTATFTATLNGVGASLFGYTMLTNPNETTSYKTQYGVDCLPEVVQYEPKAVCAFVLDALDGSGSDMFVNWQAPGLGRLANFLALTATDVTNQQVLNISDNDMTPTENAVYEIDFDPASNGASRVGTTYSAGPLSTYNAVIHPDLSQIPSGTTATVEFSAVMQPAATTTFGPNVVVPVTQPATFTWDFSCSNVTVGANDPSGVAEGTVLRYCLPQESNLNLVVR
jgi:hypothetical protein